jgi:iron complex outermembrane receptor protein
MKSTKLKLVRSFVVGVISLTAILAGTRPVCAQVTDEKDLIPEIIVTAEKREERLSDVPISITAVSGDQLQRQGVNSTDDLARVVPGFTYAKSDFGEPVYTLRGIGFFDTSIGGSPAVAVYVDEVPIPYSSETRGAAFDLERVEVLNGPQGTLFGQNTTGGAISYVAAKPTANLSAGAQIDYGRFNLINGQAFVSGPLIPGVTVRLSGRTEHRDDWQESYGPNDARFGQSSGTLGARRFDEGRMILDWAAADILSLSVNINGWHDGSDSQAPQFVAFVPGGAFTPFNAGTYAAFSGLQPTTQNARSAGWTIQGENYGHDDYFHQISIRGDLDLTSAVRITSITAYSGFREHSTTDQDGTAFLDQEVQRDASIHSFSQELRASATDGPVHLIAGVNYDRDTSDDKLLFQFNATNSYIGPFHYASENEFNKQHVETYAGFADADYSLTDTVTLTGGARYTRQARDFEGCIADSGDGTFAGTFAALFQIPAQPGQCVTQSAPGQLIDGMVYKNLDQNNTSWRIGSNWKFNSASLLYANVTKGFKSGSFSTVPGIFASQFTPVTQESVLSYETGFKTAFFQRRIQVDGAVFYYDYANKQLLGYGVFPPIGKLPILVNIPRSRVAGAELQSVFQPTSGLRFSAGMTYVNSRVQSDPPNPTDAFGNSVSFVGESFPNTPQWQGVLDAEYKFAVSQRLKMYVGGGTVSRSHASAAFGDSPLLQIPSYTLIDLRAGLEPIDGPWRVEFWGHNIANKYYLISSSHQADAVVQYAGMPVTYGITLLWSYR